MIRRAFTLIELCVVISVLALVATIAVPSVVAMQNARAARSTLEAVRRLPFTARLKAREDGKTVILRYESGSGELALTVDDESVGSVTLGEGVSVSSIDLDDTTKTADEVKFYEDGTADAATVRVFGGGVERYLRIAKDGTAQWVEAPPQVQDEEWQAGEIEQRAAG